MERQQLKKSILSEMRRFERRRAQMHVLLSLSVLCMASIAIWIACRSILSDLAGSGFYEYVSLVLSNPSMVLTFWKELLLSLIETLPFEWITLAVASIGAWMLSVRVLVKARPLRVFVFAH